MNEDLKKHSWKNAKTWIFPWLGLPMWNDGIVSPIPAMDA